jgi:hypothetical protein
MFGSHLYSQIVVPLIVASVCLAIAASVVAVYFLRDLTSKWVTQVADSTTNGVVDRYAQNNEAMSHFARALAEDDAIRNPVAAGDMAALRTELSSEMAVLPYSGIAVIDTTGRVVASAGSVTVTPGAVIEGWLPTFASVASATIIQTRTEPASVVAIEEIAGAHGERLAVYQHIDDSLLTQLAGAANGGFCFYSAQGSHVACMVSSTLPPDARRALGQALMSGNPAVQAAIDGARTAGTGRSTIALGADKYRVIARKLAGTGDASGETEGYIVGSVSQGASDEA